MTRARSGGDERGRALPRRLRPLAWAQFLSSTGSAMLLLGITYLAYSSSGSILRTVLVTIAYVAPTVVLGFVAGRFADEHDDAHIVIVVNSAKAVLYLGLAAASAAGVLDATSLLLFSLVNGSLSAFLFPAWQAYQHGLVTSDQLDELNATWAAVMSIGSLVGAAAGGLVINQWGATPAFVFDALTILPLVVAIARTPSRRRTDHPGRAHRLDLRTTLSRIRNQPALRRPLVRVAVLSMLVAPVSHLLPAIAADLHPGPHMLGALTALFGTGSMFVAWRLRHLKTRLDHEQLQRRVFVLASLFLIGFAVARAFAGPVSIGIAVIAGLFGLGLLIAMARSVLTALLQVEADPTMEGAVLAALGATFAVFSSLGALVLATAATWFDVFTVLGGAGLVLAAITVGGVVRTRRLPDPVVPTTEAGLGRTRA
jgi:MFS family permease